MTAPAVVVDEVFETIRAYREAARNLARDESLGERRHLPIVRVLERAKRDHADDAWLVGVLQRVIWAEAEELLRFGRTPKAPAPSWTGHPTIAALWCLRRHGRQECPTCRRPVPSGDVLASWEDADRAALAGALTREGAVEIDRAPDGAA